MFSEEPSARTIKKKDYKQLPRLLNSFFLGVKLFTHNHRLIGEQARFSEKIASYGW